ncbi:arginine and glutamate-rich 1 isoform X2 [Pelobates cultripes]|uniref:Arginine and glutamate-rich 1 isoform X2 n=1 Tax=Pelobates cultripes TaxID=61616 RepID=A0AAD1VQB4_PELCU|nr:arginine and glutamate-rich 1 isoform X2 [Pelobates cultripes]
MEYDSYDEGGSDEELPSAELAPSGSSAVALGQVKIPPGDRLWELGTPGSADDACAVSPPRGIVGRDVSGAGSELPPSCRHWLAAVRRRPQVGIYRTNSRRVPVYPLQCHRGDMGRSRSRSSSRSKHVKSSKHNKKRSRSREKERVRKRSKSRESKRNRRRESRSRSRSNTASRRERERPSSPPDRIDIFGRNLSKRSSLDEKQKREDEEKKLEYERQRRMQQEIEEKLIEEETARRVEELVAKRVEEELEKRKDEIEREVLRRVEEAKRIMEKQLLEELERQRQAELAAQKAREVTLGRLESSHSPWQNFLSFFFFGFALFDM